MYWIRLNLVVPDARVIWNPFSQKKALQLCRENAYDCVITSGPPHSTHLIGLFLKKRIKIQWITDFRDPWTKIFYLKSQRQNALIKSINKALEKKVVKNADTNLVISEAISGELPFGEKRILYNAFDERQFKTISYHISDKFRVKYVGQLTEGQDIITILQLLNGLVADVKIQNIEFSFIGTKEIPEFIPSYIINKLDFIDHSSALSEMVNCELLILLINSYHNSRGILTTKLFEYIGARTPILCIGPKDGEAAKVIKSVNAGYIFDSGDDKIIDYVFSVYQGWLSGMPFRNDSDISQWSVQQQVDLLKELLHYHNGR